MTDTVINAASRTPLTENCNHEAAGHVNDKIAVIAKNESYFCEFIDYWCAVIAHTAASASPVH
jgi:hypothetical protein